MKSLKLFLAAGLLGASLASAAAGFDVFEYSVEGNTVLAETDIERAVYPFLGPDKTVADVEKARAALEAAYQQNGYLSVSVALPEQSVAGGVIRLQVVEGQVERLKVSGNQFTSRNELRAAVPELAPGKVPHFPTMQAELAQAGSTPDRRVTPLLRPGVRPGTMEVELAVEDSLPLHGNVEINNRQSPDTSPLRLEAGLRYTNLFQKQHSAGLNYVVAPQHPEEVAVLSGFYNAPLSPTRSLSAFVQYSNSDIVSALGSNAVGKGSTIGARFSQTLPTPPAIANFFHSLSLGADYKDLKQTQNALGTDLKQTPLLYMPLVAQYTFSHMSESGELAGNLGVVVNLGTHSRDLDCQGVNLDQFECSRADARPGFSATRGELAYSKRQLGWEGLTKLNFQLSGDSLVSSEQFLAGGMDSVRGYYEGEAAGDYGLRLGAELRTPSLVDADGVSLRAAAFVEGAQLWLNNALPGQTSHFSLASAGVGLRLKGDKDGLVIATDLAQALSDGPNTAKGKLRLLFRVNYGF